MQRCKYLNSEPWNFPHSFMKFPQQNQALHSYQTCCLEQQRELWAGRCPSGPTTG